jgi:hypothetical protein
MPPTTDFVEVAQPGVDWEVGGIKNILLRPQVELGEPTGTLHGKVVLVVWRRPHLEAGETACSKINTIATRPPLHTMGHHTRIPWHQCRQLIQMALRNLNMHLAGAAPAAQHDGAGHLRHAFAAASHCQQAADQGHQVRF